MLGKQRIETMLHVSKALRRQRLEIGMSIGEMAKHLRCSVSQLTLLEGGSFTGVQTQTLDAAARWVDDYDNKRICINLPIYVPATLREKEQGQMFQRVTAKAHRALAARQRT